MAMLQRFRTEGYNGYSLQFSPFFPNKLAVAASANFGLVGNGRLFILNAGPQGMIPEKLFDTQDGLFDCAWSEAHENQIATASGDGSIKLWDVALRDFPIRNWHEHTREVFSVHWNYIKKDTFASGSWDHSIKIWTPEAPKSLITFLEHQHCVYNTIWCPRNPDLLASASGDQTFKIWDIKSPRSAQTVHGHNAEILSIDWNKYKDQTVVTGSVDHTIKVWDLRMTNQEVSCMRGHEYAVRRVKCSPHNGNIIGSVSYDMTMRLWDTSLPNPMIDIHDLHTEFVVGMDFNLFDAQIATAAWDEQIHMFVPPSLAGRR